jgi:hypothetical protein
MVYPLATVQHYNNIVMQSRNASLVGYVLLVIQPQYAMKKQLIKHFMFEYSVAKNS